MNIGIYFLLYYQTYSGLCTPAMTCIITGGDILKCLNNNGWGINSQL